jgi:hypothetical protein
MYGAVSVQDALQGGDRLRTLFHGRIAHGSQSIGKSHRREPTLYYGRESGGAIALQRPAGSHRTGVVGLGTGTLAAYGQPGDTFRFYEINPLITRVALSQFTYLQDSKANVELVAGDARISLDHEHPQNFDTLILDAFSGDSIPVHLLTSEAFGSYVRHLRPGGVLAINASNQYLDLTPVIAKLAQLHGMQTLRVPSAEDRIRHTCVAEWLLVSSDLGFLADVESRRRGYRILPNAIRPWTDQYSNLLAVLR